MSQLAAVRPADATSAQREVIDAIVGGDRGRDRSLDSLLDERGALIGPFNAWVHRPDLGIRRPRASVSGCDFTGVCRVRRGRSRS